MKTGARKLHSILFLLWVLIGLSVPLVSVHASQVTYIPVYHYHNWEPFYFKEGASKKGFSLVLVEQLNEFFRKRRPDLKIYFRLQPIARPELNQILKDGQQGLILWANLLWFKRLFEQPYFIASAPIYWDNDAVVSLSKSPMEYVEPESLIGKHIGGLPGHYYHGVNQLVDQGKILRSNAINDRTNLKRLIEGKVDAIIITQTAFNFVKPDYPSVSFYQSFVPQDSYSRHILITPEYQYMEELLNFFISSLPHNKEWVNVLAEYGLEDLVVPFTLDLNELNNFSIEK
ncbi:hypothetical protein [Litoribrevibacter albus]|uniref:ABC transporter substrate-binding protein n=1 Tax=Litoribrevibacter albus TaxID=1473156 RepID=A0AA37SC84_9GAMM|nr:hypothetical protein [Litoribrevibacter albus]GLQ32641.1 ABC transporter substrate-binding protein [Litoribrevibacter albus]